MARLTLALLGPLQITLDDRPVTGLDSDKVRALLIYLALEADRPQRRATLATMLWPEQSERAARHNLSQALFNLRRALGDHAAQPPFLLLTRDAAQLNAASDTVVDALIFEARIAACAAHTHRRTQNCAACAEQLVAALELYRGDFLDQFALSDSDAFEEWSLQRRERLRLAALGAADAVAAHYELRGDYGRAAACALRQLAIDPWREPAHRQLMRALALDGQRSAALAAYSRCRQILADQLGIEPEQDTTSLYERIRDAAPEALSGALQQASPAALRHNLPAQLTPFVGRERELAQLGALLADPQCRLLTIHGPGGIGKTRLAVQAAREHLELFTDGACFVPLAHLVEPRLLAPTIANALGLTLYGPDEPAAQLLAHLRDKEVLIVLDNFEQLVAASPWLSELLQAAPGVTLLVTSRERLDLHSEWLVELGGLALPDEPDGAALERSAAGQLWLQTARRVQPGYTLSDASRRHVAAICAMLEGMPLAIELAAGRARFLASEEIAQSIAQGLALLTSRSRDLPERHRSMRAAIDQSWDTLPVDERHVLRRLAVFRGGFQSDAAARVADASPEQLAALVDKSLLRLNAPATGPRRYDLHELVRQYLVEQLDTAGELEQAELRRLRYMLELAEQAAPHFAGAEETAWAGRLEAEHANVRAALTWALGHCETEAAGRICAAAWRFWQARGQLEEGRQWIARTLRQADELQEHPAQGLNPLTRAHLHKAAGSLAWAQSDYHDAAAAFTAALALYQALDDREGISAVVNNLGVLALYQGDFEQAETLLERSLALRRERGDSAGTAACLLNLGALAGKRGDLPRAQAYYEASLAAHRALGNERAIAMLLNNLAVLAEELAQLAQAQVWATESLALWRRLENNWGVATALVTLGSLAARRSDALEARAYYRESLALFEAVGDRDYIATVVEGFAAIAVVEKRWEQVALLAAAAEALRQAIGIPLQPSMRAERDRRLALAQEHLSQSQFEQVWQEGTALPLEQVLAPLR